MLFAQREGSRRLIDDGRIDVTIGTLVAATLIELVTSDICAQHYVA